MKTPIKVTIMYDDGTGIYVEGKDAEVWSKRISAMEGICSVRPYLNLPEINWKDIK